MNERLFWAKVARSADADCWLWQGSSWRGYGRYNGRKAHRIAYELTRGPIPAGAVLRHSCDRPACCNPAHLLPGSQRDNLADAVRRGRLATGQRNGRAKLTDEQVASLRSEAESLSLAALATRYGISKTAAHYIVKRRSRK